MIIKKSEAGDERGGEGRGGRRRKWKRGDEEKEKHGVKVVDI